ncbi:MAG: glycosyltransferase family 4 protein [Acidobacteria bacterium]|nr:glycosyltransferase family 4 protein [Acidobacteriota bacterium]
MRLAVFTSHFPGLINTFFARDMRGLIDAGWDVEIFAILPLDPAYWAHVPADLSPSVLPRDRVHHASLKRSLAHAASPGALRHVGTMLALTGAGVRHGAEEALKTMYVLPKALAWARDHRGRFDHVLAYWGNYAGTCAYLFHRAIGGTMPFSICLHAGTDLYRARVYLRQKLDYADNVIVVCDFNRKFLAATYPDRVAAWAPKLYLHHLALDLEQLSFDPGGRAPHRLLAAGGLHPAKGFDDLLAAAALVAPERPVEVVFAGDGPERPRLEALAVSLGLRDRVHFRGWLSPDEVVKEMRQATVLVHPSNGLGDAVPTVIKEAMAVGTPVIASSIAGIPELLGDGDAGVLTPPADPVALGRAIVALLNDEPRRQRLAVTARRRAEMLFDQRQNGPALARRLAQSRRGGPAGAALSAAEARPCTSK